MRRTVLFFALLTLSGGCRKANQSLGGQEFAYQLGQRFGIPCADTIPHELTIYVTHENVDETHLGAYNLVLKLGGTKVYEGPYQEKVKVNRLCQNNISTRFNTLGVCLIKGNKVYYFTRKTSFDIIEDHDIYLKLTGATNRYGNNYQEKTGGELFYSW